LGLFGALRQRRDDGTADFILIEQGDMKDMGRLVEIQRGAGVQFVVQGSSLRMHGRSVRPEGMQQ